MRSFLLNARPIVVSLQEKVKLKTLVPHENLRTKVFIQTNQMKSSHKSYICVSISQLKADGHIFEMYITCQMFKATYKQRHSCKKVTEECAHSTNKTNLSADEAKMRYFPLFK